MNNTLNKQLRLLILLFNESKKDLTYTPNTDSHNKRVVKYLKFYEKINNTSFETVKLLILTEDRKNKKIKISPDFINRGLINIFHNHGFNNFILEKFKENHYYFYNRNLGYYVINTKK